jgi:hypothetical protein
MGWYGNAGAMPADSHRSDAAPEIVESAIKASV